MSWAVCPKHQRHLCAARLLGRGSIDPSAQKQLEHIWLPDGVTPASLEAPGHWELTPARSWAWGLCHGASLCRQPSSLCSGGFTPLELQENQGVKVSRNPTRDQSPQCSPWDSTLVCICFCASVSPAVALLKVCQGWGEVFLDALPGEEWQILIKHRFLLEWEDFILFASSCCSFRMKQLYHGEEAPTLDGGTALHTVSLHFNSSVDTPFPWCSLVMGL